jgi:hypothetical protein
MSDRDDAEWESAPDDPRSEHRILREDFTDDASKKSEATLRYVRFLEQRTRQLEGAIENYLQTLPANALRAELLAQIYGSRPAAARDLNLLTKIERRLINQYTRIDKEDRALFRLLVKRLAENYEGNDGDDDHDDPMNENDPKPGCAQPVGTGGAR